MERRPRRWPFRLTIPNGYSLLEGYTRVESTPQGVYIAGVVAEAGDPPSVMEEADYLTGFRPTILTMQDEYWVQHPDPRYWARGPLQTMVPPIPQFTAMNSVIFNATTTVVTVMADQQMDQSLVTASASVGGGGITWTRPPISLTTEDFHPYCLCQSISLIRHKA